MIAVVGNTVIKGHTLMKISVAHLHLTTPISESNDLGSILYSLLNIL